MNMSGSVDNDNDEGGDLGLGKGLKPGAVPKEGFQFEFVDRIPGSETCRTGNRSRAASHLDQTDANGGNDTLSRQCSASDECISSPVKTSTTANAVNEDKEKDSTVPAVTETSDAIFGGNKLKSFTKITEKLKKLRKELMVGSPEEPADCEKNASNNNSFSLNFDDVTIGTSLKQQKKLFESELAELMSKNKMSELNSPNDHQNKRSENSHGNGFIDPKLLQAEQEAESLKQQVELCQRHLEAKYKAIQVLQNQICALQQEQANNAKAATLTNRNLQQEINQLQFEFEHQQSTFMESQQVWAERFDSVCQENSKLSASLEARGNEVRHLNAEKMIVCRERDELLALLDIQERHRYENVRSQSTDDAFSDLTSVELATLSACRCRGNGPDPCACSHSAAQTRREVVRLKQELEQYKQNHQEAITTTDAYRIAFEEQLSHNRSLTKQLAAFSAAPLQSKSSKARAAVRWLVKQLNEEEPRLPEKVGPADDHLVNSETETDLDGKSEDELLCMLVDMVSDRSEALAHQRLAARMLASKTKELEQKLSAATEEVFDK